MTEIFGPLGTVNTATTAGGRAFPTSNSLPCRNRPCSSTDFFRQLHFRIGAQSLFGFIGECGQAAKS